MCEEASRRAAAGCCSTESEIARVGAKQDRMSGLAKCSQIWRMPYEERLPVLQLLLKLGGVHNRGCDPAGISAAVEQQQTHHPLQQRLPSSVRQRGTEEPTGTPIPTQLSQCHIQPTHINPLTSLTRSGWSFAKIS